MADDNDNASARRENGRARGASTIRATIKVIGWIITLGPRSAPLERPFGTRGTTPRTAQTPPFVSIASPCPPEPSQAGGENRSKISFVRLYIFFPRGESSGRSFGEIPRRESRCDTARPCRRPLPSWFLAFTGHRVLLPPPQGPSVGHPDEGVILKTFLGGISSPMK